MEFVGFPKISRFSREVIISEKIDGTNGQIYIVSDEDVLGHASMDTKQAIAYDSLNYFMFAGSRTQYITTENDNHGFAKWVKENAIELFKLGPGRHFGEWWGQGIQRNYGLKEKRFSLFNVIRWNVDMFYHFKINPWEKGDQKSPRPEFVFPPSCCDTIPIITTGILGEIDIYNILENLKVFGSYAAPYFMKPEGIVIYHVAGNVSFKKTIEKDDEPKSKGETNVK